MLAAFGACAASGELGPLLLLLFPLSLVGAHFFGARVAGKAEWAWTVFLAGALLFFAFAVFTGQLDIVLAAARFSSLLCLHRLWHRKGERDEMLLLLLSLLLLCAGAALSAELLFGVGFLGYSIAATWALALTHLRFEIEAGRGPEGSAALLQSRRLATPALLGALAALSLLGMVGSAIVFFTFPRVTIGGLRRPSTGEPVAGLGDQIDLKRHGIIADDPRVVLRVRLTPQPPTSRVNIGLHWRARALPKWTGQGWRADNAGVTPVGHLVARPELAKPSRAQAHNRLQSMLLADIEAVAGFSDGVILTPPGWPLQVEFSRPLSARGAPQRLYHNSSGDLFYVPAEVGDLRYLVTVDQNEPPIEQLRGRGRQYPASVRGDLELPQTLDPRLKALSDRLTRGRDPVDAAVEVERYLSTTFAYTRDLPGEQDDPIAFFLFERKQGHCELFSSAMVMLLRSAGIPARNVTGFYGGRRTDAGYFAVRAGDAHSWVEVYLPGAGFISFDPTPAADRGSVQEGLWPRLVLFWDAIQQRWRVFVVDYDLLSQTQLLKRAAALFSEAGRRLSGKGGGGAAFQAAWAKAIGAGVGLSLVAFFFMRRRRGQRRASRGPTLGQDERRAVKLWRQVRGRLARAGVAVNDATTPREAAARALIAGPAAAAAVAELANTCLAARWGGAALPPQAARALLRKLDTTLRPGRARATCAPS